jgi:hypothetical protein
MTTPRSQDLSRTLVRVVEVEQNTGSVKVIVPGWDATRAVYLRLTALPQSLRKQLRPGKRFHARATVGALGAAEFRICDFEDD